MGKTVFSAIAAVLLLAAPAFAQDKPVEFNVGFGATFPVSNLKNDFDAGQLIPGESDPHVHHNPAAVLLRTKAVNGEIHSDLAYSAEWREYELIGGPRHARVPISRRLPVRRRHPRKARLRP